MMVMSAPPKTFDDVTANRGSTLKWVTATDYPASTERLSFMRGIRKESFQNCRPELVRTRRNDSE